MCIKCIEAHNPGKKVTYIDISDLGWRLTQFGKNMQEAAPALSARIEADYGKGFMADVVDFSVLGVFKLEDKT